MGWQEGAGNGGLALPVTVIATAPDGESSRLRKIGVGELRISFVGEGVDDGVGLGVVVEEQGLHGDWQVGGIPKLQYLDLYVYRGEDKECVSALTLDPVTTATL